MGLNRKRVVCRLQVGRVSLPQVEEFKYLGVLFTSEGKMEREIDGLRWGVTREELGVEPLLLHIERNQFRWLGHLFRMPLGHLPGEVFRACPTGRRPRGRPRTCWRDYVSQLAWQRLGVHLEELEDVSGSLELFAETAAPVTR
ncbi:hypothetical protein QQF64_007433 [Cirrhinus molitorella]|uniref:Uncharacterized protein n=1 Tax=Cirrhinus molitorella TaxID=172907 RepID=A0ABR3MAL1_9TELE